MTASFDVFRHPDGSINFDHYRSAAAQERQQAFGRVLNRFAVATMSAVAMLADRSARTSSRPGSLAR